MREIVVQTIHDVRRLAVELRPKALDDFGLVPAIERLAESLAERTGIRIDVQANRMEERLPGTVETTLYRVVQEALTNVVKHSSAAHVGIVLTRTAQSATAVVEDDGRGFAAEETHEGIGLPGMRERLAVIGGRLEIESSVAGSTVRAEVPIR